LDQLMNWLFSYLKTWNQPELVLQICMLLVLPEL
jgi:hypothetical protein